MAPVTRSHGKAPGKRAEGPRAGGGGSGAAAAQRVRKPLGRGSTKPAPGKSAPRPLAGGSMPLGGPAAGQLAGSSLKTASKKRSRGDVEDSDDDDDDDDDEDDNSDNNNGSATRRHNGGEEDEGEDDEEDEDEEEEDEDDDDGEQPQPMAGRGRQTKKARTAATTAALYASQTRRTRTTTPQAPAAASAVATTDPIVGPAEVSRGVSEADAHDERVAAVDDRQPQPMTQQPATESPVGTTLAESSAQKTRKTKSKKTKTKTRKTKMTTAMTGRTETELGTMAETTAGTPATTMGMSTGMTTGVTAGTTTVVPTSRVLRPRPQKRQREAAEASDDDDETSETEKKQKTKKQKLGVGAKGAKTSQPAQKKPRQKQKEAEEEEEERQQQQQQQNEREKENRPVRRRAAIITARPPPAPAQSSRAARAAARTARAEAAEDAAQAAATTLPVIEATPTIAAAATRQPSPQLADTTMATTTTPPAEATSPPSRKRARAAADDGSDGEEDRPRNGGQAGQAVHAEQQQRQGVARAPKAKKAKVGAAEPEAVATEPAWAAELPQEAGSAAAATQEEGEGLEERSVAAFVADNQQQQQSSHVADAGAAASPKAQGAQPTHEGDDDSNTAMPHAFSPALPPPPSSSPPPAAARPGSDIDELLLPMAGPPTTGAATEMELPFWALTRPSPEPEDDVDEEGGQPHWYDWSRLVPPGARDPPSSEEDEEDGDHAPDDQPLGDTFDGDVDTSGEQPNGSETPPAPYYNEEWGSTPQDTHFPDSGPDADGQGSSEAITSSGDGNVGNNEAEDDVGVTAADAAAAAGLGGNDFALGSGDSPLYMAEPATGGFSSSSLEGRMDERETGLAWVEDPCLLVHDDPDDALPPAAGVLSAGALGTPGEPSAPTLLPEAVVDATVPPAEPELPSEAARRDAAVAVEAANSTGASAGAALNGRPASPVALPPAAAMAAAADVAAAATNDAASGLQAEEESYHLPTDAFTGHDDAQVASYLLQESQLALDRHDAVAAAVREVEARIAATPPAPSLAALWLQRELSELCRKRQERAEAFVAAWERYRWYTSSTGQHSGQ